MLISLEKRRFVLELTAGGASETAALQAAGLTSTQWSNALAADAKLAELYERAKEQGYHALADSLLRIPDEATDLVRARLKCDNIKWLLSKRHAKMYGERVNHEHTHTVDIRAALGERKERAGLRPIRDLSPAALPQGPGMTEESAEETTGSPPVVEELDIFS